MDFLKKNVKNILAGIASGFINGLLGAGGGIIITHYLSSILSDEQKRDNGVFANAVATMLPISVFSLALYYYKGLFEVSEELVSLLPSALIGGILGAYLLTKLRFKWVKRLFSALVIVSGFIMIFR